VKQLNFLRQCTWFWLTGLLVLMATNALPAMGAPITLATFDYDSAPKFALIVGNQRYSQWPSLRNAQSDARLMNSTFKSLGYQTTLVENADARTLRQSLGQFADALAKGGVGAVYFAGHGVQSNGRNYLLPIDMPKGSAVAQASALSVDELLKTVRNSGAQVSLVLLDACRNDPGNGGAVQRWRGAGVEGFAEPSRVLPGMLVAYATQAGERALDGTGANSPFAAALARWLPEPGIRLTDAMEQVKRQVRNDTQDDQRPMIESSLVTDFPLTRKPVQTREARSSGPAPGLASTPTNWFQWTDKQQLMVLANEIERRARAVNPDDLPLLEHQARKGSAMAQAVLGRAWRQGFGVGQQQQRSAIKAKKWLNMAAAQHMPYALNELGEMHYLGHGGPKQADVARKLFQESVDLGYQPAKLNLLQVDLESHLSTPDKLPEVLKNWPR
jgi:hypothetical protein